MRYWANLAFAAWFLAGVLFFSLIYYLPLHFEMLAGVRLTRLTWYMSINYTILKSSIVNSSIWNEDSDTRVVWITMLALRNKDGEIYASLGGLAHQSRVSREKTAEAIAKFLAPEPDSSSRDDGRRIVEIPGGWRLLNHERIKTEAQVANKTSYMAQYMAERRAHVKRSKSLPSAGEMEYMAAVKRGATEDELDKIVESHLPKNPPATPLD